MTQWYGPQGTTYHVNGQGGQWVDNGQGSWTWQPYAGSSADPNKTIWYGPNANYPGASPTPVTPPPAPDPYQNWLSGDPGSRSYRYFTPDLQQYYEQNPDQAYRQYVTSEYGDRQTPLADYARGKYSDYWAQYIRASEADPTGGAGWTNYLTNNLADKIRNSFNMQSPTQKGYTDYFQPSGRVTW